MAGLGVGVGVSECCLDGRDLLGKGNVNCCKERSL